MNDYQIKIEVFEGPFELLFSLIEKEKVDIYQVPLAKITSEYLSYIKSLENLDFDLAGEFLVMSALLLKLKSKKLLPDQKIIEDEKEEFESQEELISRLVEYKIFKQLAENLKERAEAFSKVYFRKGSDLPIEKEYRLKDVSLEDLTKIFIELWQTSFLKNEVEVLYQEELSLDEKKEQILEKIKKCPTGFDFMEIIDKGSRFELVVCFLAILELVKMNKIRLMQKNFLGPIFICSGENNQN